MSTADVSKPLSSELLRSGPACGLKQGDVDRDGGDKQAGVIRGLAVITRGEVQGHGLWIDEEMLASIEDAINASGKMGVKARFTHPGLSNDGLGSFLGRVKHARRDGELVRADLHFSKSAHDTPDGDLADYVMRLAEDDPGSFGTSIAFRRDRSEEEKHRVANSSEERGFVSPDKQNKQNLPHARMKSLYAVDAVDSPAANPGGLFHRNDIPAEAESLLSYALGLTDKQPELVTLSVDPVRAARFVTHFLERHKLQVSPKEDAMSKTTVPTPTEIKAEDSACFAQQAAAELERRAQLSALCKLAKVDDATRDLMVAAGFDSKGAQEYLAQTGHLSAANPPVTEHVTDPTGRAQPSKEDQFGAEWDAHKDVFARQGVSREQYIKSRSKD